MKNWFKFNWFSSQERKELIEPEKTLGVAVSEEKPTRPYRNAIFSSGNITVVDHDGDTISGVGDYELFSKIKQCTTMREVEDLLIPKEVVTITSKEQDQQIIKDNLGVLKAHRDFLVNGDVVVLRGVSLAIPAPIVSSFIEILERQQIAMQQGAVRSVVDDYDDQFLALKMFWLKLALNPLPQSREDLLAFIRRNDVRITRNGNLILYRRVVTKSGADTQLVTFVTQNYYKLKKEGLDPRHYAIYKNGDNYGLVDLNSYDPITSGIKPFCNLQQMYLELPLMETNTFTAAHDKSVEIKLGGIYRITKGKINLDNGLCAAGGLHAAAVDYNYSGFGDMPVVVLVNPSKAITVPTGDMGKLRTTEMFVACVNDKPQGTHFDESALGSFDSEYHDLSLEELEEAARSKSFEGLSVQDEVPSVSLTDLNSIKDMLRGRIKAIV